MSRSRRDRAVKPRVNVKSALTFVVRGYKGAIAGMAVTAFLAGLSEAMFLVMVTRAAFAITGGESRIPVAWGWSLPLASMVALLVSLVVIKTALAFSTTWQSAHVSTQIVARLRHRLSRAFLDASW